MGSFKPVREIPKGTRSGINNTVAVLAAGVVVTGYEASVSLPANKVVSLFGVSRDDVAIGAAGNFQQEGKAVVRVGTGGVTAGDDLTVDADGSGRAVTWNAATGVNQRMFGTAEQTGAADTYVEASVNFPAPLAQGA